MSGAAATVADLLDGADVIVAVATASGRGAVGIVRLSGPRERLVALAEGLVGFPLPPPRRASLRRVRDGEGQTLDEAVVLHFPGPASFTGEDVLEIQAHGGPLVLDGIVSACVLAGARPARPGEFLRRAFAHGRIDILRAEAIDALIRAEGEEGLAVARRHLGGALHEQLDRWRDGLLAAAAGAEALIDFPEDADPVVARALLAQAGGLWKDLVALARTWDAGRRRIEGAHVVLLGPVNAGKSTLFNSLLGEDRAIVSPTAGTTRDVLREVARWQGFPIWLHDTAGLREADDPVEREGVARSQGAQARADLCVWVRRVLPGEWPVEPAKEGIQVVTHRDQLDATRVGRWEASGALVVDARTASDAARVQAAVVARLRLGTPSDGLVLHTPRQRLAAERAAGELRIALELPEGELGLLAFHLREAGAALEELAGRFAPDDVLDALFSRFCLGK